MKRSFFFIISIVLYLHANAQTIISNSSHLPKTNEVEFSVVPVPGEQAFLSLVLSKKDEKLYVLKKYDYQFNLLWESDIIVREPKKTKIYNGFEDILILNGHIKVIIYSSEKKVNSKYLVIDIDTHTGEHRSKTVMHTYPAKDPRNLIRSESPDKSKYLFLYQTSTTGMSYDGKSFNIGKLDYLIYDLATNTKKEGFFKVPRAGYHYVQTCISDDGDIFFADIEDAYFIIKKYDVATGELDEITFEDADDMVRTFPNGTIFHHPFLKISTFGDLIINEYRSYNNEPILMYYPSNYTIPIKEQPRVYYYAINANEFKRTGSYNTVPESLTERLEKINAQREFVHKYPYDYFKSLNPTFLRNIKSTYPQSNGGSYLLLERRYRIFTTEGAEFERNYQGNMEYNKGRDVSQGSVNEEVIIFRINKNGTFDWTSIIDKHQTGFSGLSFFSAQIADKIHFFFEENEAFNDQGDNIYLVSVDETGIISEKIPIFDTYNAKSSLINEQCHYLDEQHVILRFWEKYKPNMISYIIKID